MKANPYTIMESDLYIHLRQPEGNTFKQSSKTHQPFRLGNVDGAKVLKQREQQHLAYAIFTLNPDGYIVEWNEGAQKMYGYTAQEITGRHVSVFYMEAEVANSEPHNNISVTINRGHYVAEGWRLHKDASRFKALVVIIPLYDDSGKLTGFTNITQSLARVELNELSRSL